MFVLDEENFWRNYFASTSVFCNTVSRENKNTENHVKSQMEFRVPGIEMKCSATTLSPTPRPAGRGHHHVPGREGLRRPEDAAVGGAGKARDGPDRGRPHLPPLPQGHPPRHQPGRRGPCLASCQGSGPPIHSMGGRGPSAVLAGKCRTTPMLIWWSQRLGGYRPTTGWTILLSVMPCCPCIVVS